MTRKQLPKAIRPASLNVVKKVVDAVAGNEKASPARPLHPRDATESEWAQAASSAVPANDAFVSDTSLHLQRLTARRHVIADRIVESHGTYAALSGLAPLPAVNIASVAAVIMHMLKQLSQLYRVQFERERTRPLIIAILGGAAPTGLGLATVSTIGLVAPAPAFLGLAISALTAAAVTRAIGQVFVESFERQSPLG
jgi:uncharacterized protein (DUF697 family)